MLPRAGDLEMTPREAAVALRASLVAAYKAKGTNLTEDEWLSEATSVLTPILTPKKRQTGSGTGFSMGVGLSDDQWLTEIGAQPAFSGLNVRQEVESCRVWSATNNCQPTRRRIVNWLLKALRDRPMRATQQKFAGLGQPVVPKDQVELEPMGWREEFPDFSQVGDPWHKVEPTARAHICRQMAELAQRQA